VSCGRERALGGGRGSSRWPTAAAHSPGALAICLPLSLPRSATCSYTAALLAGPPYHLAIVVGGLSAEMTLKTVKYASTRYLDSLPTSGSPAGRAFRDLELEAQVLALTQRIGIGAQFGGKYFCHDVRIIRLPRHGASCPVGIGVSCSADRQAIAKIDAEGVWIEALETDPAKYLPEVSQRVVDRTRILKGALQLRISRYRYIHSAQVPERVSTKSFVVSIIGNSKSSYLGAQGTFKRVDAVFGLLEIDAAQIHVHKFTIRDGLPCEGALIYLSIYLYIYIYIYICISIYICICSPTYITRFPVRSNAPSVL